MQNICINLSVFFIFKKKDENYIIFNKIWINYYVIDDQ